MNLAQHAKRNLPEKRVAPHGRTLLVDSPLVFHCHYYNIWLQHTLLLVGDGATSGLIVDAAQVESGGLLSSLAPGATSEEERRRIAQDVFSELGFGLVDLSQLTVDGGEARFPVSHYGQALDSVGAVKSGHPSALFDAGYAAAAAAFIFDRPIETFSAHLLACQSLGAPEGLARVFRRTAPLPFEAASIGPHGEGTVESSSISTPVDTNEIMTVCRQFDLSGNDEGLIPRFNVMLTGHLANFCNRIVFETIRAEENASMIDALEMLLVNAGNRCAFHTFGGIMLSAEWDAVIRPRLNTALDWVAGMVAVVNCLGWGKWQPLDVSPERAVFRIYDDYESTGWLAMYDDKRPGVSYLAQGAAEGLMNLIFGGDIASRPVLDDAYYDRVFDSNNSYQATQIRSRSSGDPWTEIEVKLSTLAK